MAIASAQVFAADDLDSLKRRKADLERQLETLNSRIVELESAPAGGNALQAKYFVKDFGINKVNSAGGVEPYFVFYNPNKASPIKYLRAQITLFNAVGDILSSSIGAKTTAGISYTGPLTNADGETRVDWGPIWYNTTGDCIRVESMQVTFMDGKATTFVGKNLKAALAPELSNSCKAKRSK